MDAFALLCRTEGIIPAIETAHALAGALQLGRELGPDAVILVNLSGRGDKDVDTAASGSASSATTSWSQPAASRRRAGPAGRVRARAGDARRSSRLDDRSRPPGPRAGPRWSATCRPASRRRGRRSTAMVAMVEAGVDVVEVGLPYSDPLMDGPVIQHAVEAALAARRRASPTCSRAVAAVADDRRAGAGDDLLEPGRALRRRPRSPATWPRPAEPGSSPRTSSPTRPATWIAAADAHGLDRVFLVAPSLDRRAARAGTGAACRGFVYAASTMGVTGARTTRRRRRRAPWSRRARAVTDLPVCVGLGVSNGDQAAEVAAFADGVIVGSAFVRCLLDAPTPAEGLTAAARADRRARRRRPCRSLSRWGCATATGSSTSSGCWPGSCWAACWSSPAP